MFKFGIDLLSQASILIGLFTMLGLIFLKKSFSEILSGTLKATAGFLILGAGGGVITQALHPFGQMITQAFGIKGLIPNNEAMFAFVIGEHSSDGSLIMICGLFIHLLIARFSPIKFIYLTGHLTLYMAIMLSVVFKSAGFTGWAPIAWASLICGASMSLSPLLTYHFMRKVLGRQDSFAMAQFSNITYALSGLIGMWVGKGSRSTEELKMPKNLDFFRDTTAAVAVTMLILYIVCALLSGQQYVETYLSKGQHYLVFALMSALTFAAGVAVLFYGIRMIIDEILPAFQGISEKLVPHSIPALDCPVIFPCAPNAVLLGFLCSLAGGFSGLAFQTFAGMTLVIPGIVPHFFTGATAGVFGNATGGRRGCVIGAYVHGFLSAFLPLLLLPFMGPYQNVNAIFSDSDFIFVGAGLGGLLRLFGH